MSSLFHTGGKTARAFLKSSFIKGRVLINMNKNVSAQPSHFFVGIVIKPEKPQEHPSKSETVVLLKFR